MKKQLLFIFALILSLSTAFAQGHRYGQGRGSNNPQGRGQHGNGVHAPPMQGMHQGQFQRVLMDVSFRNSDRDRFDAAKRAVRTNSLSSDQVRQLMDLLTFESNKIALAKVSYMTVIDPHNFFVVNSSFRFRSSAQELDNFVASQGVGNVGYQGPGVSVTGGVNTTPVYAPVAHYHGMQSCNRACDPNMSGYALHLPLPMCNQTFPRLVRTVEAKCFDNDKVMIIKQALRNQFVTSDQVRQLMDLMTFDRYKLEVAKFAYKRTIDPHNYFIVSDGFTFSSYMRDLDRYIMSCG